MKVTNLYLKTASGADMTAVEHMRFTPKGIQDNVACQPLRQVLISSLPVSEECGLLAGDLRENVVIDGRGLYQLKSGTVVNVGPARIRLTFHCEPCKGILGKVKLRDILHKRGVLGCFLNSGQINIGDSFSISDEQLEAIPYDVKDRIKWYISQQSKPVEAVKLVYDIGLAKSYLRALPSLIRRTPEIDPASIVFKSHAKLAENPRLPFI